MSTKIGDVFQLTGKYNNYFLHIVAIDELDLFSDVAVLYDINPLETNEKELSKHVVLYTHTFRDEGLKANLWHKIGNIQTKINTKMLLFKNYRDSETIEMATDIENADPEWAVWTVGQLKWKTMKYKKGLKLNAEDGGVAPSSDIIYRIDNGKSLFFKGYENDL